MKIMAIDPGPAQSAFVILVDGVVEHAEKTANHSMIDLIFGYDFPREGVVDVIAIEQVRSYGMPVGAEIFDTVQWTGRFMQACRHPDGVVLVPRLQVKSHLCHSGKARDANIRQAIVDRYGGKERAIGKKASKGPLYGVSGDCWSALAVALVVLDRGQQARVA